MADIGKLKLSRRNLKGQLTRTLAMMDNLIGNGDEDTQILQKYITKAEEQFSKIEQKHSELIDLVEDQSQFEEEETWMTECEKEFIQVLVRAKRVVDQATKFAGNNQQQPLSASSSPHQSRMSEVPTHPVSTGTSQSCPLFSPTRHQQDQLHGASTPSSSTAPRMARMKFPTFSGDVREYKRFKELFQHCTSELSEMECFFQLTEAMINPRERDLIKGCISVTRAWEVLDGYYGDEDKIVDSLLKDLDNLKSYELKGKVDLPAMQRFVQTLQTFETHAETVGLAGELNSKIMLSNIRQKLPEEHRIAFLKSVRDDATQDTLQGLNRWLYSQLLLLDKAKSASHPEPPTPYKRQTQSSNAAAVKSYPRNDGHVPKCPLHVDSKTHFLKTCNTFRNLSLKEKYDIMEKNNICTRCGHNNCTAGQPPYDHKLCQFPSPCRIYTCGSDTHFSAICPVVFGDKDQHAASLNSHTPPFNPTTLKAGVKTVTNPRDERLQGTLPTVMGYLRHGNSRQLVRILLDGGSQASLVREGLFPRTGQDYYQDHDLTLVGGAKIHRKLRILDCSIEDMEGNWSYPVSLTEIDQPCGEAPVVQPQDLQLYDHLCGVDIKVAPSEVVDVLLGVDNTHLMIWQDHILGEKTDEPVAVRCPFGWFIQGGRSPCSTQMSNYINVSAIGPLEEFIGLETVGLQPRKCKCSSEISDRGATEAMQQSVRQQPDGSYEVQLPWKRSPEDLPDNYAYAVKRLKSLENQFKDRPKEWEVYCKQMRDQLDRGVSRRVTEKEIQQDRASGRKMWFLPHFAVKKDSTTTPVRVVYDGKARFQGHSLNDYLIKGENVNTGIFEVALRFRENEVGVIADISKMFQAIKIRPDDARFHRFVFRENPSHPVEVYELTTVTFGDKPSPTAAVVTLRHVVQEHAPDDIGLQRVVREQFYVDDLNESVAKLEDALELKAKLKETLSKGNFTIRKWQSNAEAVCDETEDKKSATVLGTKWDLSKDTLKVKDVKPVYDVPTKRAILSQTASYYDVFGVLSGVLVRPKILLQKLWQLDVGWDMPLSPNHEICTMLNKINSDLEEAVNIEIPRCLIPKAFQGRRPLPEVSLHGFSDASEDAMGMGVWLRWSASEESEAHLSFVAARARLTPLKQSSMPRKELQAILLLSRLMVTLKTALRFSITYSKIWTDSMTAISWLKGQSKSFRSFVAYRVGEITSDFNPHQDIAYVPSDQNVIDIVSRGSDAKGMQSVIDGPTFLKLPPSSWPETPRTVPVEEVEGERKKFHIRNAKMMALKANAVSQPTPFVDPTDFSSWQRLKMVTARVLSLREIPKKEWLKKLTQQISQWPSSKLLKEAELYWIREAQKDVNFQDPNIMRLDPFYDEDDKVFRVGGRIRHAPLSYDIRHPYLLPRGSHISLLVVRDGHSLALHGGQLRTAAEVRKRYWVIGDSVLSKRVVKNCIVCKKHRGRPLEQKMADLPESRVKPCTPPFQTTLVDYLGPINVKVNRNTTAKGYCAVFTCATTRAVHLTCVPDLSTQAFLQALDRFISIRGAPATIISDNGTCFRGAHNTINELNLKLDRTAFREHCNRFRVQWKFGPPGGPHHQGAVERMVQEVKKAMRHLVKADRLSFPEWETILCQISSLINSRPVTAMSSSPLDHPPLTPNHFLIGRGDLSSPDVPCESYHGDFRKRRELCNALVDRFWMRWMDSIHKLTPRPKNQQSSDNLGKGDIVLVIGEDKRRGNWRMAEVTQTFAGTDHLVRVVEIRFAEGATAKRPVTKLILLMKGTERNDLTHD